MKYIFELIPGKFTEMPDKALIAEKTLKQIIRKAARSSDLTISPTCTIKDLGIDSLEVIQILVAVEDAFGIDLQEKELKTIANMGEFFAYIKSKMAEKSQLCNK